MRCRPYSLLNSKIMKITKEILLTQFVLLFIYRPLAFTDEKQGEMLDFKHLLCAESCLFFYIINELNGVSQVLPIYLKPNGIIFRVTQLKILISRFCPVGLRFEFRLDIKNWHYCFDICEFLTYIYINDFIFR